MKTKKETIWKTITIGGKKEYVFPADMYVSDWAKDIQSKTPLAKKKEKVNLVVLSVSDLGFTDRVTTTELFDEKNLAKYGVALCPAEVGLALRKQYTDQPHGEWLYVAMNPITDSGGRPFVFLVGRPSGGARWLLGRWVRQGNVWYRGYRIVFRLRKSPLNSDTLTSILDSGTVSSDSLAELSSEATLESRVEKIEQWIANVRNQLL